MQKDEELAKKDADYEALAKQFAEFKIKVANQQSQPQQISLPHQIDASSQAVPRCF